MAAERKRPKRTTRKERDAIHSVLSDMRDEGVTAKPKRKVTPNAKRRREYQRQKKEEERLAAGGSMHCHGFNIYGEPCKAPPLTPGSIIDESEPVSGNFCLMHDPAVDPSAWKKRFRGEKDGEAARQTRPLELLAEAVAKAPALLFESHFNALGLEWNETTQELQPKINQNTGKRSKGATLVGFSREGVAKKSAHDDFALKAKVAEQLADRLYGKAKVSMEVGAGIGLGTVKIPPDEDRAMEVISILHEVGAIPAGNGAPKDDLARENRAKPRKTGTKAGKTT